MEDPRALRFLEIWKHQARLKRERLQHVLSQKPTDLRAAMLQEDWLSRLQNNLETRKLWLQTRLENVTAVLKIVDAAAKGRHHQGSSSSSLATPKTGRKIKKQSSEPSRA